MMELMLNGVLQSFKKQSTNQNYLELSFEERFTDLLQSEIQFKSMNFLTTEIRNARASGNYLNFIEKFTKNKVIILDDLFVSKITLNDEYELLEIVEATINKSSLIITSQYAVKDWFAQFNNPTLADAILDRIVHNSYRYELVSEISKRKKKI